MTAGQRENVAVTKPTAGLSQVRTRSVILADTRPNALTEVERPFRMGLAFTLQRRGEWGRRTLDEPDC